MKNLLKYAAFVVASTLCSFTALAQHQSKVNVPFTFHVQGATLPAGAYTITVDSRTRVVGISQWESKTSVQTVAMRDSYSTSKANRMIFNRVGGQYFLHELTGNTSASAYFFVPTRAEKQARKQIERAGLQPEELVVLATN